MSLQIISKVILVAKTLSSHHIVLVSPLPAVTIEQVGMLPVHFIPEIRKLWRDHPDYANCDPRHAGPLGCKDAGIVSCVIEYDKSMYDMGDTYDTIHPRELT